MDCSEHCTVEWVKKELALWEEGVNARIAELRAQVAELSERVEQLEKHQPESLLDAPLLVDLTGLS